MTTKPEHELWQGGPARPASSPARSETDDFWQLMWPPLKAAVRRHKRWIVFAAILGALGGGAAAFLIPHRYKSIALVLLVQSTKPEAQTEELLGAGPRPNEAYAKAILLSHAVAQDVIKSLSLTMTASQLVDKLDVENSKEGLMTVACTDRDPKQAEQIVAEYLKAYRQYTDSSVLTVAKGERVFIERQLSLCRDRLKTAEQNILTFEKSQPQLGMEALRLSGSAARAEQGASEASLQLAQAKDLNLHKKYQAVIRQLRGDKTFPALIDDPTLTNLQALLVDSRVELDNLKISLTDNDPKVVAQREKIAGLDGEVTRRIAELEHSVSGGLYRSIAESDGELKMATIRLHGAKKSLASVNAEIGRQAENDIILTRLKREFEVQDKLYRDLESAHQAALLAEAREPIYLVVLDPPTFGRENFLFENKYWISALVGAWLAMTLTLIVAAMRAPLRGLN